MVLNPAYVHNALADLRIMNEAEDGGAESLASKFESSDTSSSTRWTRAAALPSVCPQAVAAAVVDEALALRCRRLDPGQQRRNSGIIRRAVCRRLRVTPLPPHTRRSQAVRGQRRPSVGAGGGAAARHGCKGGAQHGCKGGGGAAAAAASSIVVAGRLPPRLDIIPTSRLAPSHHDRRSTSPPRPHYLLLCTNITIAMLCGPHNILSQAQSLCRKQQFTGAIRTGLLRFGAAGLIGGARESREPISCSPHDLDRSPTVGERLMGCATTREGMVRVAWHDAQSPRR